MSPLARDVMAMLRTLHVAQGQPVPAVRLAERVYAHERTIQRWLKALETAGMVECVQHGGRQRRGRAVEGWQPRAVEVRGRDGTRFLQYVLQI